MSDFDALIDHCRRAGFRVTLGGNGHWQIEGPNGRVAAAASPSDRRAVHNLRAELRRAGILPRPCKLNSKELDFLRRFEDGKLRGEEEIPQRLIDKGYIRVSSRRNGWIAWLTPQGETMVERS